MRMIVYTAMFGREDYLSDPVDCDNSIRKYCFTDLKLNKEKTKYKIIRTDFSGLNPTKKNRRVKINFPYAVPHCDYSLYIDTYIQLKIDPVSLIKKLDKDSDILVFKHPFNSCVYQEAKFILSCGRFIKKGQAFIDTLKRQVEKYKNEGYPEKNGLYWCGFLFRRHTEKMIEFSRDWWDEVKNNSERDQVSFPYMVKKHGIKLTVLNQPIGSNPICRSVGRK